MILVDSVYIHNGGGKNILDNLCIKIQEFELENNFFFLLDSRYSPEIKLKNSKTIHPSEFNRLKFYRQNSKDFERIICLSNVPPPIKIYKPVDIYFHNDLLISPIKNSLTLFNKLKLVLKRFYIQLINTNKYVWNVQTDLMRKKLKNEFNISRNNINVFPIFDEYHLQKSNKKFRKNFLYVSNFSEHKNHWLLFKAFQIVSNKLNYQISLELTLPNNVFSSSFYSKEIVNKNLKIVNHGILNKLELSKLYSETTFMIFPSLNESFGLPLIEAVLNDCYVISSDRDYVYEIIEPSLIFNPDSPESIASAIYEALSSNSLRQSKLRIENKIDTFIKYILSNV
tara:strand:+ start:632 stop:1651 length:1020 start_codon:yes stop_codon:yes gene_type:complete